MAAGKRRRLKLEIDIQARPNVVQNKNIIKNLSMASVPDATPASPMANAPEPTSPFTYPALASIHSPQPMSRASASLAAARRRRSSKGSMSSSLKRSASTPNVRGLVAGDGGMSLADKRRNKLGYHRTSVACGSKAGSGEASTSSSSSPALAGGPVMDQFAQFHPLPLTAQDYPSVGPPLSATASSPSRRASDNSRTYEFSYRHDRSHWESPFYDHGPTSAGHSTPEDPSHPYWRLGDSPMTPAFQQLSGPPGPPNTLINQAFEPRSSFAAFTSPREDHAWPVAPRSMSFGHVEDLSHSYPNPYQSPLSMDYRRRPLEMYPPSLQSSSENSKNNSLAEVSTPPLSAAVSSQSMAHFVSPTWNALPGHSVMSKAPEYSTWYSEPAPLAKVQEEEVLPSFSNGPGAAFTSVG
ncbi:MAG: hypothetical protein Q9222_001094 [Ikaeria aurantiellina]